MVGRAAQIGVINPTSGRLGVAVPFKMKPDPPNTYSLSKEIRKKKQGRKASKKNKKKEKKRERKKDMALVKTNKVENLTD